jgi:hypothetical protein
MEYSAVFLSGLDPSPPRRTYPTGSGGQSRRASSVPPTTSGESPSVPATTRGDLDRGAPPTSYNNAGSQPNTPSRATSMRERRPRMAPLKPLFVLTEESASNNRPEDRTTRPPPQARPMLRPRSYTNALPPCSPPPTGPLPSPNSGWPGMLQPPPMSSPSANAPQQRRDVSRGSSLPRKLA